MTRILDKVVNPSDCTLAIALPLTREEFFADLRPDAPKDYVKCYRSQIWEKPAADELWTLYRDHFSNLVEDVAQEVASLGVKVVRNLKLTDLPSLLGEREIVTLLSHWKAADIEPDDFVDFDIFLRKLKTSSEELIVDLRSKLSEDLVSQLENVEACLISMPVFKKKVTKELNYLLETESLKMAAGTSSSNTEQPLHKVHRSFFNRLALDAAFDQELKKGNRMEFFDGLKSAEDIRAQIPDSFEGLLDLIVCNSVLPAESIKSLKRNCLIISNENPADANFRLLLYKATIRALNKEPGSFLNTMMEVRQMLGNYLKRL